MIPRAQVAEWRAMVPWAQDWQVEQDLVISRALVEIFSDDLLRSELAFRGGTALHKLYFKPAERYSEDIDLVRVKTGPIRPVIDALRARIEPWLGHASYEGKDRTSTLKFRFLSEGLPPVNLRLKVEINVREQLALDGLRALPFRVESRWFSGAAEIVTFSIEELLATKLRALYQRSKGRDTFDLDRALQLDDPPSAARIVEYFAAYLVNEDKRVSRAEFEANLHAKRRSPDFLGDVSRLLATEAPTYDVGRALDRVQAELVQLLPGDAWAGAGGATRPTSSPTSRTVPS